MRGKRSHRTERLAKIYDAEILPLWSQRFGRMLLRKLRVPSKAMVLDVGTGTGYPALELLDRLDEQSRVVSIDPASPMLDVARRKAGALVGKRVFLKSESAGPRLSFASDAFDAVICNAALDHIGRPAATLTELARVAKPGSPVLVTLPLRGTYDPFLDLLREVLARRELGAALEQLSAYHARMPSVASVRTWFERAGLLDVQLEQESYQLLFRSSREFFCAPIVEYGPLLAWKKIAGGGEQMQQVFSDVKRAIDTYFAGRPFALTVRAGCASGRKPTGEERAHAIAEEVALDEANDEHLTDSHTDMLDEEDEELENLELLPRCFPPPAASQRRR